MKLSLPNMHRADFVLIVHNMFERQRAVSISYLRAKAQIGDVMNGELFAEMSSDDLQNAARRMTFNIPGQRTSGENFFAIHECCN